MRPLLALVVAAAILGGLQLYMMFRPQPVRRPADAEQMATGRFAVEVTLTFDAGPDAFAVDLSNSPSLLVQLRGREILRVTDSISAGEQRTIDDIEGLVVGNNEFFVQATPQDLTQPIARGIRVRIFRDDTPIADSSLWAEPGDVVQGGLSVSIPAWSGAPIGVDGDAGPELEKTDD